jgi:hypothetical protein
MNSNYIRVIPRDLFNEAKLLKCMGQLCLLIHDRLTPVEMSFNEPEEPFEIALMDEGALTITNLHVKIKGKVFLFKTTYNSKSNYPLYLEYDYCDYPVFTEKGDFDEEFIEFCKIVK